MIETKDGVFTIDTEKELVKQEEIYDLLPVYTNKVLYNIEPLFKTISEPFNFDAPQYDPRKLAGQLQRTMKEYKGIGLAAIQCNIPLRVFALACDIVCFNPVIVSTSETKKEQKEGCLSFPGLFFPVLRPEDVVLKWYDHEGKESQAYFEGLTARVILHEYDHLEGIVYTSLVGSLTLDLAQRRRKKMFKRAKRQQFNITT